MGHPSFFVPGGYKRLLPYPKEEHIFPAPGRKSRQTGECKAFVRESSLTEIHLRSILKLRLIHVIPALAGLTEYTGGKSPNDINPNGKGSNDKSPNGKSLDAERLNDKSLDDKDSNDKSPGNKGLKDKCPDEKSPDDK